MEQKIPATAEIRGRLALIGHAQTHDISRNSRVPVTPLWKIRNGVTGNPRIETVGKIFHLIESDKAAANVNNADLSLEAQMTEAGQVARHPLVRCADDRAMLAAMKGQGT